jgi:hypothetical protein
MPFLATTSYVRSPMIGFLAHRERRDGLRPRFGGITVS